MVPSTRRIRTGLQAPGAACSGSWASGAACVSRSPLATRPSAAARPPGSSRRSCRSVRPWRCRRRVELRHVVQQVQRSEEQRPCRGVPASRPRSTGEGEVRRAHGLGRAIYAVRATRNGSERAHGLGEGLACRSHGGFWGTVRHGQEEATDEQGGATTCKDDCGTAAGRRR